MPFNYTQITYYDCMPSPYQMKINDWENPNFWARFPYWTEKKQRQTLKVTSKYKNPTQVIKDELYLGTAGA